MLDTSVLRCRGHFEAHSLRSDLIEVLEQTFGFCLAHGVLKGHLNHSLPENQVHRTGSR